MISRIFWPVKLRLSLLVLCAFLLMSSTVFADQVEYFYDNSGRLQWVQEGGDVRNYRYDKVGNLLSVITTHAVVPVIQSIDPDVFVIGNSHNATISGQNLLAANSITSDNPLVTALILDTTDTAVTAMVTVADAASPGQVVLTVTTPYGSAPAPVSLCAPIVDPDSVVLSIGGSASYSVTLTPPLSKDVTSPITNKTPTIISMPFSILIPAGGAGHFTVNALATGIGLLNVGSAASTVTVDVSGESVTLPVSTYVDASGDGCSAASLPVSVFTEIPLSNGSATSQPVSVFTEMPLSNGSATSQPVSVFTEIMLNSGTGASLPVSVGWSP
jgi:hypothetical protein